MKIYSNKNVFEAALDRIRYIFDNEENIYVSSSGGKDSTVIVELALIVAKEKNRLPLHVCFCDQESEYDATVEYFRKLSNRPEIKLHWFQVPFILTNATSLDENDVWLHCWNPKEKDKWIRPHEPNAITDMGLPHDARFYTVCENMGDYVFGKDSRYVDLLGIRGEESLVRYMLMHKENAVYKDCVFASKGHRKNTYRFYPIYDWSYTDVWHFIAKHNLLYNDMYNKMFQKGVEVRAMRVSSIIHETGVHGLKNLQEFEPKTYDRLVNRIGGINTYNQTHKKDLYAIKKLPSVFSSWIEYRDYLIEKIIVPKNRHIFYNAFKGHNTEELARADCKCVLLNDICLTKHGNTKAAERLKQKKEKLNNGSKK